MCMCSSDCLQRRYRTINTYLEAAHSVKSLSEVGRRKAPAPLTNLVSFSPAGCAEASISLPGPSILSTEGNAPHWRREMLTSTSQNKMDNERQRFATVYGRSVFLLPLFLLWHRLQDARPGSSGTVSPFRPGFLPLGLSLSTVTFSALPDVVLA